MSIFFADYLASPAFGNDVFQMLLDTTCRCLLHRRSWSLVHSVNLLSQLLLFRIMESFVLEALLKTRFTLLHDAGISHLVFRCVQQYRFYRCWLTRLFTSIGNIFLPRGLQDVLGTREAEGIPTTPVGRTAAAADPLKNLPSEYSQSISHYRHMYDQSVPYAVFVSSLVNEMSQGITEQLVWFVEFLRSRHKRTSRWRLLKPYIASMVGNTAQMVLVYSLRVIGAWVGRAISREPTRGSVFWVESITLLAASPLIYRASALFAVLTYSKLEKLHPATLEDEQEDSREKEKREEEEEEEMNAFNMNFNANTNSNASNSLSSVPQINFYEVLGVQETATTEDIKRAYKKSALANHPDRVSHEAGAQNAARERMAQINQAYETLSSESQRRRYDMSRQVGSGIDALKHFENLPTSVGVGIGCIGIVGMSMTASLLLYGQYCAAFHQLTGLGRYPLRFFGIA